MTLSSTHNVKIAWGLRDCLCWITYKLGYINKIIVFIWGCVSLIKHIKWPLPLSHFSLAKQRLFSKHWRFFLVNGSLLRSFAQHIAAWELSYKCLCMNAHNFADKCPLCALITTLNVSVCECAWQNKGSACHGGKHSVNN